MSDKYKADEADFTQLAEIARETLIGRVGIITPDGYPRVVPINFALLDGRIYFHGALSGEKYDVFATNPKVTISIDIPYAALPSYWQSEQYGCKANQFYKSVLVKGRGSLVTEVAEKTASLQALMEKHQPEGRFTKLTPDEPLYKKVIAETGIYRIDPEQITVKTSFGQNMTERLRNKIIDLLEERDSEVDLKTTEEVRKTLVEDFDYTEGKHDE